MTGSLLSSLTEFPTPITNSARLASKILIIDQGIASDTAEAIETSSAYEVILTNKKPSARPTALPSALSITGQIALAQLSSILDEALELVLAGFSQYDT